MTLNKNAPEQHVLSFIQDIIDDRQSLVITLRDDTESVIGKLVPLTRKHLENEQVIGKLTDWRNANMQFFLTQFTATPERTKTWLDQVVFKTPTQLMFLIYAGDDMIGHFGFKDLTADDVMLDNAMRGERGGHPKLLQIAGRALIEWLFSKTGVKKVLGYVLSNNASAIMMNRTMGFGGWHKYPLNKSLVDGETRLVLGERGAASNDNIYCYYIEIDRSGC
ncbi:GNAT family N-acetyltransferase [Agrobacterium sp. ES01]|uniref:GNAT family N-acetyltransferase n=1 Tax=Agrobacterium sp. ES01 TaxID=3420714 RepID=UPI003D110448